MSEPSFETRPAVRAPSSPDTAGTAADNPIPAAATTSLRRDLLMHLRTDGPSSPEGLAASLGVSRTGVLQQLHALEAAGLVQRTTVRHGVGRPRHVYDVTESAQDLFPTNYDGLASGLLSAIRSIGGEDLVDSVFAERGRATLTRIRQRLADRLPSDAPMADRVRELAVIQDEQGYIAEATVEADGAIRLVERNCAIHRVSSVHGAACAAELALFRDLLGDDVVRETHIAAGDRCCTYRIGGSTD